MTVTNSGATGQTVAGVGRAFGAAAVVKQAIVTLSDAQSPPSRTGRVPGPTTRSVRFTVPRGAALLNASIAWPASAAGTGNPNAPVRVILVDPAGRLAAHSLPQGDTGYGSAQVLRPAAGGWTAVIFSDTAKAGGTAGAVRFAASVSHAIRFGAVSPSAARPAPRAAAVVHVSARVPAARATRAVPWCSPSGARGHRRGRRAGERAGHAARPGADRARA